MKRVEVFVMTTLFSTRTSLGHTSGRKRGRGHTVALFLLALLVAIVAAAVAADGSAAAVAVTFVAVIVLFAALTFVWASR